MAYKRVTEEERWLIYRWRQAGTGLREVARRLGRAASSISRELLRNTGGRPDIRCRGSKPTRRRRRRLGGLVPGGSRSWCGPTPRRGSKQAGRRR
jgi:IS30 family transposase